MRDGRFAAQRNFSGDAVARRRPVTLSRTEVGEDRREPHHRLLVEKLRENDHDFMRVWDVSALVPISSGWARGRACGRVCKSTGAGRTRMCSPRSRHANLATVRRVAHGYATTTLIGQRPGEPI